MPDSRREDQEEMISRSMCGEVGAFLMNLGIKYNMFAFSFVLQFVVFIIPEVIFLLALYKVLLNNKGNVISFINPQQ